MEDSKLQGMKRAELQRLAKKAGIKANLKTDAIIEALQKYYSDSDSLASSGELPSNISSSMERSKSDATSGAEMTSSETSSLSATEESVEKDNTWTSPKRVVRRGRKGRKKKAKEEARPADDLTLDKTSQIPTAQSDEKQKTEVSQTTNITPKADSTGPSTKNTPEVPNRRKTRSVTPKTGNKILTIGQAPVLRRTTRSVTPKAESSKPAKGETKNSGKKVGKKKSGISSDQEMKKTIMTDLEKKAEEQASLQSKIPKSKTMVAVTTKPITPGNKDWSRIHQAQFDKMESIADYMARKRKRTETLCASAKKAKLVADEAGVAVGNLTSPYSLQGGHAKLVADEAGVDVGNLTSPYSLQGGHAKIAKPVSRVRSNISFSSPKFSTRTPVPKSSFAKATGIKSVTFKTSRLKTPTRATMLLGGGGGGLVQKRKSTPGPRKSMSVIDTSTKKPVLDLTSNRKSIGDKRKSLGATTPFKFGQTVSTPGVDPSHKTAFDLKASLSKPLGYKPYTGKLKPLETSSTFSSASNIQKAKVNIMKKPALKTLDTRRAGARQTRAAKRANNVMARRGIKAM